MERLSTAGARLTPLTEGWTLTLTASGACDHPDRVDRTVALPAEVPGTVAASLERAGLFDRLEPEPLHDRDAWYFLDLPSGPPGEAVLRFDGLATLAEVYVNGERRLESDSMFERHDLPVELTGDDRIALCFRALGPHLQRPGPRARWRPGMMNQQGLRLVRTTLLGFMPGWCPEVHAVGPYRAVTLIRPGPAEIAGVALHANLAGPSTGRLTLEFMAGGEGFSLACHGAEAQAVALGDGRWRAELEVDGIEPWYPHTHGKPTLYDVALRAGVETHALGHVGFRHVEVDRGPDGEGFGLVVNGVPVFARGAVWTSADIVRLPCTHAEYLPLLEKAVEAGMNMIRIGGTMTYESPAFFACCDRLGIMVWQDFMFANFDYPVRDEAFVAHVEREARDLLDAVQGAPSLVVLCGGSEMYQQAAMLGLPRTLWEGPLTETILAECASRYRPDVPYVPNSPFGGAMPFAPGSGVTHYYGVGAYERPLEDARRADVRFAAETLAFSQVPQQAMLDRHLTVPAVHDPRWKARVPRDRDASWDFEDTRDHYLNRLYGLDTARLRREDPVRYLDMSRAVTGEVTEAVFSEWRRKGSSCRGGLIWTLRDLVPGAGWGVIDATGEPKPVFYALKRAFRPLQLVLTDEGTNGLLIHAINEHPEEMQVVLEIACLRDGQQTVVSGRRPLTLQARESVSLPATDLFGAFFDTTYAYRFGPPSHEVTVARLRSEASDTVVAECFHFPLGRQAALFAAPIETSLVRDDEGWVLALSSDRFAQSVHVNCEEHRPSDDWFHLAPGLAKSIRLQPRAGVDPGTLPAGTVQTLASRQVVSF